MKKIIVPLKPVLSKSPIDYEFYKQKSNPSKITYKDDEENEFNYDAKIVSVTIDYLFNNLFAATYDEVTDTCLLPINIFEAFKEAVVVSIYNMKRTRHWDDILNFNAETSTGGTSTSVEKWNPETIWELLPPYARTLLDSTGLLGIDWKNSSIEELIVEFDPNWFITKEQFNIIIFGSKNGSLYDLETPDNSSIIAGINYLYNLIQTTDYVSIFADGVKVNEVNWGDKADTSEVEIIKDNVDLLDIKTKNINNNGIDYNAINLIGGTATAFTFTSGNIGSNVNLNVVGTSTASIINKEYMNNSINSALSPKQNKVLFSDIGPYHLVESAIEGNYNSIQNLTNYVISGFDVLANPEEEKEIEINKTSIVPLTSLSPIVSGGVINTPSTIPVGTIINITSHINLSAPSTGNVSLYNGTNNSTPINPGYNFTNETNPIIGFQIKVIDSSLPRGENEIYAGDILGLAFSNKGSTDYFVLKTSYFGFRTLGGNITAVTSDTVVNLSNTAGTNITIVLDSHKATLDLHTFQISNLETSQSQQDTRLDLHDVKLKNFSNDGTTITNVVISSSSFFNGTFQTGQMGSGVNLQTMGTTTASPTNKGYVDSQNDTQNTRLNILETEQIAQNNRLSDLENNSGSVGNTPTTLLPPTAGNNSSQQTFTLSDSIANYKKIEFIFSQTNGPSGASNTEFSTQTMLDIFNNVIPTSNQRININNFTRTNNIPFGATGTNILTSYTAIGTTIYLTIRGYK